MSDLDDYGYHNDSAGSQDDGNDSGQPDGGAKWDQAFRPEDHGMVRVTDARLADLRYPPNMSGLQAGMVQRILSRLIDWAIVLLIVVIADYTYGLGKLATQFNLNGGVTVPAQALPTSLDTLANIWDEPALRTMLFLFTGIVLLLYRLAFYLSCRRTLGQLLANVVLTDNNGVPFTRGSAFGKALGTTLIDLSVLGPIADLAVRDMHPLKRSMGDLMCGAFPLHYERWQKRAMAAIYEEDRRVVSATVDARGRKKSSYEGLD